MIKSLTPCYIPSNETDLNEIDLNHELASVGTERDKVLLFFHFPYVANYNFFKSFSVLYGGSSMQADIRIVKFLCNWCYHKMIYFSLDLEMFNAY